MCESNDDKLEKLLIKQRLQRSSKESNARHISGPGTSAMSADHTLNTTTQTSASKFIFTNNGNYFDVKSYINHKKQKLINLKCFNL